MEKIFNPAKYLVRSNLLCLNDFNNCIEFLYLFIFEVNSILDTKSGKYILGINKGMMEIN